MEAGTSHAGLCAPDYAINAGGIIRVCRDYLGQPATVEAEVARIHDTLVALFERAGAEHTTPLVAADQLARETLARGLSAKRKAAA